MAVGGGKWWHRVQRGGRGGEGASPYVWVERRTHRRDHRIPASCRRFPLSAPCCLFTAYCSPAPKPIRQIPDNRVGVQPNHEHRQIRIRLQRKHCMGHVVFGCRKLRNRTVLPQTAIAQHLVQRCIHRRLCAFDQFNNLCARAVDEQRPQLE